MLMLYDRSTHERRHLLSNAQHDTAVTAVKLLKTVWADIIIATIPMIYALLILLHEMS